MRERTQEERERKEERNREEGRERKRTHRGREPAGLEGLVVPDETNG